MTELGFSVVITAYRAERTLASAIQSVLAQTSPVEEIIVVDDASDDATSAIALQFGPPVTVHRLDTNQGVAAALNHGIGATRMPVLTFIDSDDLWPATRVERQRAALADPSVDMVDGWSQQFHDPTYAVTVPSEVTPLGPPQPGPGKSTMAIRREALDSVGLFDSTFRRGDALEWLSRPAVRTLSRVTLPEVLHFRRLHGANLGSTERSAQREEYAQVMRSISRRRRASRP